MPAPSPFVLLRRGGGGLLVGHLAVGNGVAGLVQARSEDERLSHTTTLLAGLHAVHGGNAGGLVCAALDGGAAVSALLLRSLAEAGSVEDLMRLAAGIDAAERLPHAVRLLAADARGAVVIEVSPQGTAVGELDSEQLAPEAASGSPVVELALLARRLRALEPQPQEGAAPAAGMVAVLVPGEPPRLHFALGPPSCAVFIRHWPGMELVADETAIPEGAPLARLAAAVAQLTGTDPDLRAAARRRLDEAEAAALEEGEAAERMAQRMDADTDDRGAAVRRLVAQSHAAELARRARGARRSGHTQGEGCQPAALQRRLMAWGRPPIRCASAHG